jgi:hypothetical protein
MISLRNLTLVCAVSAFALTSAVGHTSFAAEAPFKPQSGQAGKDVVWVPTPQALVDRMLDMAKITKDDYLIDLGAGDGRTVITAAKRGTRAHGIEYNPDMVKLAQFNAAQEKVTDKATFAQADIFASDFSKATVITLFLLPQLNIKLRPILLDMKPGTRIVSNSFNMGDWNPDETIMATADCTSWCTAYKWIIPAKAEGNWKLANGQLALKQTYQMLDGTFTVDGKAQPISEARMDGTAITFTAGGKKYAGTVDGNTMKGTVQGGGTFTASRA